MYEDDLIDIEKFLMHLQLMHIASMLGASGMHKSKKSIAYLKRIKELRLTIAALIEKNAGGAMEEELDNWRKESDDGADDGGVKCKTHPDAPHSFLRNASHNAGRYVCECEHWLGDDDDNKQARLDRKEQTEKDSIFHGENDT